MNVANIPAHQRSRLVMLPNDLRVPSQQCTTDATSALTRGLAEYMFGLSYVAPGGRFLRFAASFDEWAETEDLEEFPAFVAYTNGTVGSYAARNLTPTFGSIRYPDGTYEQAASELDISITCEVWANDPEERKNLCKMVEDACSPVDWMSGFRLELPHYFNQRATFDLISMQYLGGEREAKIREVKARFIIGGSVPRTSLQGFPVLRKVGVTVSTSATAASKPGLIIGQP